MNESRARCPRRRCSHCQRGKEDTAPCHARGSWLAVVERYVVVSLECQTAMSCGGKGRRAAGGRVADTESLSASESLPSSEHGCVCAPCCPSPCAQQGFWRLMLDLRQLYSAEADAGWPAGPQRCPDLQTRAERALGACQGSLYAGFP